MKLSVPALDFVAEELETVLDVHNPRLLRMQLHAQLFQDLVGRAHCRTCLCCRFTGDHPIIGIPRQLKSSQPHLPIKRRQKYVAERGRNHTPLRSPALRRKELPISVASRLEHRLDEAKHSAIRYLLGYQREEFLMIHRPEKVSEICIHNPLRPALDFFPDLARCVLRRSPSPISEASIVEYRLEDGLQPIEQRLLTHAVIDRRYAEHTILSWFVPLRNRVLSHRQRLIGVLFQLPLQPSQLRTQLCFKSRETLPIYTSTSPVLLHLLPGHLQVLPLVHLVD